MTTTKPTNNITALRLEMVEVWRELRAGTIQPKIVKELNNNFGKLIASVGKQLDYANARKEKPNIPFAK